VTTKRGDFVDKEVIILPKKPVEKHRLRVAAYCRVSMEDEGMLHSLNAQVTHYVNLINSNPDWQFVEVYNEKPFTGTKDTRPEFQRMIADCRAGKIDMVITKAVSRFARNTRTTLKYTRELKNLGIAVYFEEQNINTLKADGEFVLTLMAAYAQAESESVSENVKWRIKHEYERGHDVSFRFMFGYDVERGKVTINEAQAKVVREMFEMYATGESANAIAKYLTAKKVPTLRGGEWNAKHVVDMLRNERYMGDALLQKSYVNNHLEKKLVLNKGELAKYYATECMPPIVNRELFERVQKQIDQRRSDMGIGERTQPTYPFTGKIRCAVCGKNYRRRATRYGDKWQCITYSQKGKKYCASKAIPESVLMETSAKVLGLGSFDEKAFTSKVSYIEAHNDNRLVFHLMNGQEVECHWEDRSRSQSWTPEMRAMAREKKLKGAVK